MVITVHCENPKYARGDFKFKGLSELYDWLTLIRSVSEDSISQFLFGIAKDGSLDISKYGLSVKIKSDFHDYFLANRIAEQVGLIGPMGKFMPSKDKAQRFAREFDIAAQR